MNKLTKLLSVFIIAGAVGTGIAGVAGCKKDNGHKHSYDYTQITGNDEQHSVHCNNGGCDNPDFLQDHTWGKDDKCVCGATKPQQATPTVTGVTVTAANSATSVAVDGTLQLSAVVAGTNNPAQSVTWSSSDDSKATVSTTGLVTGVAEGPVTITATSTVDTTKSNTISLTVTAKGTVDPGPGPGPTDKSLYEELLAKDNVRVSIDTEATAGTHLTAYEAATAGIYVDGQDGYAAETHIEYAEEGGVKVIKQVTANSDGAAGHPNIYTIINPGPVKGEIEGVFSTKTSHVGTAGEFIVFNGDNNVKLALSKSGDNGALTCTYGSDGSVAVDGVTVKVNEYIEVYFKFNLTEGKATIKVNGKTALDNVETGMTAFNYVQLSASNKGQRVHTAKDIVICGAVKTLAESKTEANAIIDAELAKYNTADYTINGSELTAAVSTAKSAVEEAQDVAEVNQAVADCKAALKAVLKDSDIAAARTKVLDDLKAKYPKATKFTYTGLEGADAKYNNVSLYDAKIEEVTTALESKNTAAEMKAITDAAETYLEGITDAAMLTAKKTAAVEALKAHKTAEELAEFKTSYPAEGAKIEAILADEGEGSAVVKINACTTIAAVNTALNKAKADIDSIIDDADEDPATVISGCQDDLESYGNTKKTEYTAIADEIGQAVTDGKTAIGNAADLEGTDEEKKTAARNAYDEACAAIDLIVAKHEAKQAVAAYGEQVITDNSLTDTDLLAAIRGIDTTAIDNATSATVSGKADEVKTAIDLLVVKYNAKLTIAEYKTSKKAEVVGRDDVKEDIDNVEMTEIDAVTKEADITDAINKVKAKIDKIVSDLYNSYVQVTVDGYGAVNVKYGSKLTAADVYVTGMNVTAVYTDAGKATAIPEEGLTVYGATTVYVDIADKESLVNTSSWNATSESNSTDLFNVVLPSSAKKLSKGDDNGGKSFGGTKLNNVTYNDVITLGNISQGANNQGTPLTIEVKSALKSLTICTRVAESTGDKARAGKTHYYVNGVEVKVADTIEAFEPLTNLNAGDVVTVWAENTGSGGHFYICNVAAEIDTSKTPKLVTVEWLNEDGTVWKTTTHSYLDTITAPEGSPTVSGAFTGWQYNDADLPANLKLASSGTAYQMTPKSETADITINYTDGTPADEPLSYLSSAQGNALPAPENGDATHLFIGYYLQAGDEPADTDTVFDLSAATSGTYTVYAKYLEANVTIVYKADADNAGETVKLFKKADGSLVVYDAEAEEGAEKYVTATLKAAPTAPSGYTFDGWVYTVTETVEEEEVTKEVVLDLSKVEAGKTYTVTAKFSELKEETLIFTVTPSQSALVTTSTSGLATITADGEVKTATNKVTIDGKDYTPVQVNKGSSSAYLTFVFADGYTYDIKIYLGSSDNSKARTVTIEGKAQTGNAGKVDYTTKVCEWTDINSGTVKATVDGNTYIACIVITAKPV